MNDSREILRSFVGFQTNLNHAQKFNNCWQSQLRTAAPQMATWGWLETQANPHRLVCQNQKHAPQNWLLTLRPNWQYGQQQNCSISVSKLLFRNLGSTLQRQHLYVQSIIIMYHWGGSATRSLPCKNRMRLNDTIRGRFLNLSLTNQSTF